MRQKFLDGMSRAATSVCVVTTDGPAGIREKPDITLRALTTELQAQGTVVHVRSVGRFMRREGLSYKKSAAGERAEWVEDRCAAGP